MREEEGEGEREKKKLCCIKKKLTNSFRNLPDYDCWKSKIEPPTILRKRWGKSTAIPKINVTYYQKEEQF